jgi:hypothetical protein
MRKIIVGAQVSMDGVMQAPGGPTEDPTNGWNSDVVRTIHGYDAAVIWKGVHASSS